MTNSATSNVHVSILSCNQLLILDVYYSGIALHYCIMLILIPYSLILCMQVSSSNSNFLDMELSDVDDVIRRDIHHFSETELPKPTKKEILSPLSLPPTPPSHLVSVLSIGSQPDNKIAGVLKKLAGYGHEPTPTSHCCERPKEQWSARRHSPQYQNRHLSSGNYSSDLDLRRHDHLDFRDRELQDEDHSWHARHVHSNSRWRSSSRDEFHHRDCRRSVSSRDNSQCPHSPIAERRHWSSDGGATSYEKRRLDPRRLSSTSQSRRDGSRDMEDRGHHGGRPKRDRSERRNRTSNPGENPNADKELDERRSRRGRREKERQPGGKRNMLSGRRTKDEGRPPAIHSLSNQPANNEKHRSSSRDHSGMPAKNVERRDDRSNRNSRLSSCDRKNSPLSQRRDSPAKPERIPDEHKTDRESRKPTKHSDGEKKHKNGRSSQLKSATVCEIKTASAERSKTRLSASKTNEDPLNLPHSGRQVSSP